MKYLKTYKLFESSNIEADLEDIFLNVKDNHPEEKWYVTMDHYEYEDYYSVYISFGSKNPWDEDSEDEAIISKELIECIHRVKDFMNSNGYGRLDVCILFEYESGQPDIDTISLGDLKEGQRLGESQSIKLLFRKDSVNEELLPSTYISAAQKLKQKGHNRRAGELENWKKEVEEKERQIRYDQRISEMKKWGPFRLQFCKAKWNAQTKAHNYQPFFEGNFYIEPSFPYDWFQDMMHDSEQEEFSLSLPIELGVMPADGETKLEFEKCKLAGEIWEGQYWPTRVWIQLFDTGRRIPEKPNCTYESVDNDIFFFSTRAEAIRFKKLLSDALVGKNDWGKNKWNEKGLISSFEAFFKKDAEWRERHQPSDNVLDPYFTKEDLQRVSDSVKALSINDLYLD